MTKRSINIFHEIHVSFKKSALNYILFCSASDTKLQIILVTPISWYLPTFQRWTDCHIMRFRSSLEVFHAQFKSTHP